MAYHINTYNMEAYVGIEDSAVKKSMRQSHKKDDEAQMPVWRELKPGVHVAFRSTESIPVVTNSWAERAEQDKKIEEKFHKSMQMIKDAFNPGK